MTDSHATGRFIVLEGIDGAGTTTQLGLLSEKLRARNIAVLGTREPTDSAIGKQIRQGLRGEVPLARDTLALLFAADRLDHLAREILPALAAGTHVVSDRYVLSSIVYQSQDLPRDFVALINARATAPDLTLLVDAPVEVALERVQRRGGKTEIFEYEAFQRRVREAYLREADLLAEAGHKVVPIDGTGSVESVFAAVWAATKICLGITV